MEITTNIIKWTMDFSIPPRKTVSDEGALTLSIFAAIFMFCTIEVIFVKLITAFTNDYGNSQSMLNEYYYGDPDFENNNHYDSVALFNEQ